MFQLNRFGPARIIFASSFFISISIIVVIFFFLITNSLPIFYLEGWDFLTGTHWYVGEVYGALPMIYVTVLVTLLALCFAFPLGLGTAIIASEFLPERYRLIVKMVMELLAGIPGVVYGLLGIVLLTTTVQRVFNLIDGNCILTAGLLLGVMILPTIMTVSEDALRTVPKEYREQALALGLNHSEVVLTAVLPAAAKGILGAVLLSTSRAMGETISVMLVIGSLDRIPSPFFNIFTTAQTITSKLGREASEALGVGYHWNALIGLALVLFIMSMGMAFIGDIIVVKEKRV